MAAAETTEEVRDITGLSATQVDTIIDNLCESKEAAGWRLVSSKINTTLGSNPQQHWYGLFQQAAYLPGNTIGAISDPGASGAIPVTRSGTVTLVSAGAESRTMAAPSFAGQRITVFVGTAVGTITLTIATTFNAAGNNTITMNAAEDFAALESFTISAALRWRIIASNSLSLSTV